MIEIVHGVGVGAGKTYFTVKERVLPHLLRGGTVQTSDKFKLKWPELTALVLRRYGLRLQPEQWQVIDSEKIKSLHEHTVGGTDDLPVLIVIDEAQAQLNSRDTRDSGKRELFAWLCESRHDNNDVVFISQHALNIDSQVRRLVTNVVRVRNMSTIKVGGMAIPKFVLKYLGCGFRVSVWDQAEKFCSESFFIAQDPEIFAIYESKSCQGTHRRGGEPIKRIDLQKEEKKPASMQMKLLLGLLAAGILAIVFFTVPQLRKATTPAGSAQAAKVASTPSPAPKANAPAPAATPRPAFTIEREQLRAFYGHAKTPGRRSRDVLVTDKGTYVAGEISHWGMVESVSDRQGIYVALARGADRFPVYILAEPARSAVPAPLTAAK